MKVALVCEWLTDRGGAEKVLLAVHQLFPEAPIYTSQYNPKRIDWFKDADIRTGWLQIFPTKARRFLAPLRQRYFKKLDLSDYDLIISITGAEAKGVRSISKKSSKGKSSAKKSALHICYCHVPTQYYWQMYNEYLDNPGFGVLNPVARFGLKTGINPLRKRDYAAAQRPDYFVTISSYAAEMIKKYYNREAVVIAPPVETERFKIEHDAKKLGSPTSKNSPAGSTANKNDEAGRHGFINFSRQVSWKRQDLIIKACLKENKELTLIGDGPEHKNLVALAGGSSLIHFVNFSNPEELREMAAHSEAFVFPSQEPFGIAPVEALAAGCPVIAYSKGGATDYIKAGINGEFFSKQSTNSLAKALRDFDYKKYNVEKICESAEEFSAEEFKHKLKEFIDEKMAEFRAQN